MKAAPQTPFRPAPPRTGRSALLGEVAVYGLAVLLHLPLLIVAQHLGKTSGSGRVETTINLVSMPQSAEDAVKPRSVTASTLSADPATRLTGRTASPEMLSAVPSGTSPSSAAMPATASLVPPPAPTERPMAASEASLAPIVSAVPQPSPVLPFAEPVRPADLASPRSLPSLPASARALPAVRAPDMAAPTSPSPPAVSAAFAHDAAASVPTAATARTAPPASSTVAIQSPAVAIAEVAAVTSAAPRPSAPSNRPALTGPGADETSAAALAQTSQEAVITAQVEVARVTAVAPREPTPSSRSGSAMPSSVDAAGAASPSRTSQAAASPAATLRTRLAAVAESPRTAAALSASRAGREVQDYLRSYEGSGCFVAVAAQIADDAFAVSGFSRTDREWAEFNRALDARTGYRFAGGARQVSAPQCAALAFARSQPAYPAFVSRIALVANRVKSGDEIEGRVTGVSAPHLVLLLVDDEGRVQDVSALLKTLGESTDRSFRTALTLTSGPVETVQLFVSIASRQALPAIAADGSLTADDYFRALGEALSGSPDGLDIALAAFSVE